MILILGHVKPLKDEREEEGISSFSVKEGDLFLFDSMLFVYRFIRYALCSSLFKQAYNEVSSNNIINYTNCLFSLARVVFALLLYVLFIFNFL